MRLSFKEKIYFKYICQVESKSLKTYALCIHLAKHNTRTVEKLLQKIS